MSETTETTETTSYVELAHLQRKQEMDRQKRLLLDMYLHHCSRHNDIGKTFLNMDSVLKTTIEE